MQINHCFPKKGIKIINRSSQSIPYKDRQEKPHGQNAALTQSMFNQNKYPQPSVSTGRNTTARSIANNSYQFINLPPKYSQKQNGIYNTNRVTTSLQVIDFAASPSHLTSESPYNVKPTEQQKSGTFIAQSSQEIIRLGLTKIPMFHGYQEKKPATQRYNKNELSQFSYLGKRVKLEGKQQQNQEKATEATLAKGPDIYNNAQLKRSNEEIDRSLRQQRDYEYTKAIEQEKSVLLKERERLVRQAESAAQLKEENNNLLRQLSWKSKQIDDLRENLSCLQNQYKAQKTLLESEIRESQGRHRLEADYSNRERLSVSVDVRDERVRQEMLKRKFFSTDLIQAQDYFQLKQELENSFLINDKLIQEHQLFIVEVRQHRMDLNQRIQEVQHAHEQLQADNLNLRARIDDLSNRGDDKMLLIKLQNEVNFLKNKLADQLQTILEKEGELETAALQIKRIIEQNNNNKTNHHPRDNANLQQINKSLADYEDRIFKYSLLIAEKQAIIQSQKMVVGQLEGELCAYREEMQISVKKERSCENSLRNEVESLRRSLKDQKQINGLKMSTLQQAIVRKSKQIVSKDAFIKQFLIARAKQLEAASMEQLIGHLKEFFEQKGKK